jgi:hypothetical protein
LTGGWEDKSVCTTALRVIVSWPVADMQLDTVHVCSRYTMLLHRPVTESTDTIASAGLALPWRVMHVEFCSAALLLSCRELFPQLVCVIRELAAFVNCRPQVRPAPAT